MKDIELPPLPERDTSKPAEEQGVFRKFDVRRTDGSSDPGGKHHGCEYFVLDVDHDPAAHAALAAYADAIEATHPVLAADMRSRYGLARAAVEADRAQRVPDIAEIRRILSCIKSSVDSGIPVTDGWRILEALLASTPAPAQQEPSEGCDPHWSYYFKVTECKAKTPRDGDCICWHAEGTGPFDMVRHDDADQFLEWRARPPLHHRPPSPKSHPSRSASR